MSWEKYTINLSQINAIVDVLQDVGMDFTLANITSVLGRGVNDEEWVDTADGEPELKGKIYLIRKLEYANYIIVEQMQKTHDCDCNDTLVSIKFDKDKFPEDFKYEIYTDDNDFIDTEGE